MYLEIAQFGEGVSIYLDTIVSTLQLTNHITCQYSFTSNLFHSPCPTDLYYKSVFMISHSC